MKKCEKLIGFDPYTGVYEEYEIYDSDYLPNTLDIDLIYNPNSTEYKISLSAIDRYIYQLKEKQFIAKKPYKSRSIVILKDIPCG